MVVVVEVDVEVEEGREGEDGARERERKRAVFLEGASSLRLATAYRIQHKCIDTNTIWLVNESPFLSPPIFRFVSCGVPRKRGKN